MASDKSQDQAPAEERKQRLLDLGADHLAEALLTLAQRNEDASGVVERLVSAPAENMARVKKRLQGITRSRKFYDWRESDWLARDLEGLIDDMRASAPDPKAGVELAAAFFKLDKNVFERCDDSNGAVSGVFRYDGRNLFVDFAKECQDKDWVADVVFELFVDDDYGVRDVPLDSASEFLPEKQMRALVDRLWAWADAVDNNEEHAEYKRRHDFLGVLSLARQLRDAPLYEKAQITAYGEPNALLCIDIARVYFESGYAGAALEWLKRAEAESLPQWKSECEELLYEVYEKLGDKENLKKVAWRIFRRYRSPGTLEKLLKAVGEKRRGIILREECATILGSENFSYTDASFLVGIGQDGQAAQYLLRHADKLDGSRFDALVPLAQRMEEGEHWLVASVIYRALLESILQRAVSRYYHHGVRYLKKLDALAPRVQDWLGLSPHDDYKKTIAQDHRRKNSFWRRYGEPAEEID